jgi:hypothetical protein
MRSMKHRAESVLSAQHRSKIELCCVRTGQTARLYSGNIEVCAADPNAAVVRGSFCAPPFFGDGDVYST